MATSNGENVSAFQNIQEVFHCVFLWLLKDSELLYTDTSCSDARPSFFGKTIDAAFPARPIDGPGIGSQRKGPAPRLAPQQSSQARCREGSQNRRILGSSEPSLDRPLRSDVAVSPIVLRTGIALSDSLATGSGG
ncbi:hypothetical protein SUNI508_05177 [Seiridium unicorne]|uniref:Uncharacterized protein n=1 Tax=Seiridium unicorne TaxID=138068 RepID=A0ABR2V5T5_9PEZI